MLKIAIFLSIIFILSFTLLFWFIHHENKKEKAKDRLFTLVIMAILFSVIITLVFAFILFLIIGSTNVVDTIFSLDINTNQLIIIGISFLVYWMTIDNIFEMLLEYILGKNIYAILFLGVSRMVSFYIIGVIIKLNETINMTVSIGVSLIILLIELLYFFRNNKSHISS